MTTITGHTTRANGTILTATIYNADHVNHISNAQNLNADKLEGANPPTVAGHVAVFADTSGVVIADAGFAPGQGDVVGPAVVIDDRVATFDGTTGKLLQDGGQTLAQIAAGKQTINIPAGAMIARTTNGPSTGTVETTTNKRMLKTLDFDPGTAEFAQFTVSMPKSWDHTTGFTFQVEWSHAATTVNFGVVWSVAAVAISNDDAQDAAFGTAISVTDMGGTTNDLYISDESSGMTPAGSPADGDAITFQVSRVAGDGSDNLAVDARLQAIRLFYTTSANNDA